MGLAPQCAARRLPDEPRARAGFRLGATLVPPRAGRRHRAGRGLRRGPPCALVRRARLPRHRHRSRRDGGRAAARSRRNPGGRHRERKLALARPQLRRGGGHPLPVAARCCPRWSQASPPAAHSSTKPLRRATRRWAGPPIPNFLLRPGELLDALRPALRVVAYEDGFLDAPPRFMQRIVAVRERSTSDPVGAGEPSRYPLTDPGLRSAPAG